MVFQQRDLEEIESKLAQLNSAKHEVRGATLYACHCLSMCLVRSLDTQNAPRVVTLYTLSHAPKSIFSAPQLRRYHQELKAHWRDRPHAASPRHSVAAKAEHALLEAVWADPQCAAADFAGRGLKHVRPPPVSCSKPQTAYNL